MLIIAWALSFATIGILINLALNLFFRHRKQRQARYLIAFILCIGCYVLHPFFRWEMLVAPENTALLSLIGLNENECNRVHIGLWLFSEMVPWTLWMFLRSVCRDAKDSFLISMPSLAAVMLTNIYIVYRGFEVPYFLYFSNAVNFLLLFIALYELFHDIRADLSNSRRRFRNVVFSVLLIQILLIFYMEISHPLWGNVGWLLATRLVVLMASGFVSLLYFQASTEAIAEVFHSNRDMRGGGKNVLSHKARELMQLLEADGLYKNPDLSVARLAERMSVPEYKLRDLIKTELGFRNFNAFINKFRVEYAARQFRENAYTSVADIRAGAGFKSHPPFNRAFREVYGISPAEYRSNLKKQLG
jgi:AraC-like DNA-binding protein